MILTVNEYLKASSHEADEGNIHAEVLFLRMAVRALVETLESQAAPPAQVEAPDVVRCACGSMECVGAIMRSDDNEITVRSMGGNETVVMLNIPAIDQLIAMLQSMKAAQSK